MPNNRELIREALELLCDRYDNAARLCPATNPGRRRELQEKATQAHRLASCVIKTGLQYLAHEYVTDGRCHNSEPGTYNHECGKPAVWIGTQANGHASGFCADCRQSGHERHGRTWTPHPLAPAGPCPECGAPGQTRGPDGFISLCHRCSKDAEDYQEHPDDPPPFGWQPTPGN